MPIDASITRAWRVLQQEGLAIFLKRGLAWLRRKVFPAPQPVQPPDRYPGWIGQNEPDADGLSRQRQLAQSLAYRPLISVIVPVYNPDPQALAAMLQSVLDQTYADWELCVLDGNSDRQDVRETLLHFATREPRIHLKWAAKNEGIAGNTNAAIAQASGEFLAFLDHDDTLAPFALYEIACQLNQAPNLDLIYSDHDLLSADGQQRRQPLFKPDWSPEIMLSANYITHLTVIRTTLVRQAGGFDPQSDGAQDWDLFLRICERTTRIAHIPKILYHWREASGSTSQDIWAKPYAPPAQLRAITAHLARLGLHAPQAFFDASGFIRVRWQIDNPLVSIIIPSNGSNSLLENCIRSLLSRTSYPNYEIVIVNNGPRQPDQFPAYRQMMQDERVRVVHYDLPFNYSAANNFGVRHTRGELLLFLNNDTEVLAPDWLDELVLWAQRPDVGAVGAKLLQPSGTIQHAGIIVGLTGMAGHIFGGQPENQWSVFGLAEWYRDYSAVTAACLMMRRAFYDQIGGFDERFILCGNDVELCLRTWRAGLRVVYNPFARLRHIEGATRQGGIPAADFHTSYPHYLPLLQSGDPFFNPNLSYWQIAPTLADPGDQAPLAFVNDFLRTLDGAEPTSQGLSS